MQNLEKADYQVKVFQQMHNNNEMRIKEILDKRGEKERLMQMTSEKREYELMLKRELELMKREERLENVERIARANDYRKDKLLTKIEHDNLKG